MSPGGAAHAPRPTRVSFRVRAVDVAPNGVVEVQYRPGDAPKGAWQVWGDDGVLYPLRDDGRGGDSQAGDHVWSGAAYVDLARAFDRYEALAERYDRAVSEGRAPFASWFDRYVRVARAPVHLSTVALGELPDDPAPAVSPSAIGAGPVQARIPVRPPELSTLVGRVLPLYPLTGTPLVNGSDGGSLSTMGVTAAIDSERSLLVTDPSVVEHPDYTWNVCDQTGASDGPWTFRRVMEVLANEAETGITPEQMAQDFLDQWSTEQTLYGQVVPAASVQVPVVPTAPPGTTPWDHPAFSRWRDAGWDLDLAPFKLYGIVYRSDLVDLAADESGTTVAYPGEARLLFQFVDTDSTECAERLLAFNFEFTLPHRSCAEVTEYAAGWEALSALELGSAEYLAALQSLTDVFLTPGAAPDSPNGAAFGQLRLNDSVFTPFELRVRSLMAWNLREYRLTARTPYEGADGHYLTMVLTDGTPRTDTYPEGLPGWLEGDVELTGRQTAAWVLYDDADTWGTDAYVGELGITAEERMNRSLETCNGCHGGDTFPTNVTAAAVGFMHVRPPNSGGDVVVLSPFLTGNYVPNSRLPDSCADAPNTCMLATFSELERRGALVEELATLSCVAASVTATGSAGHEGAVLRRGRR